jgi:hypothetical protein
VSWVRSAACRLALPVALLGVLGSAGSAGPTRATTGLGSAGSGSSGPGTVVSSGPAGGGAGVSGPPKGAPAEQTHPAVVPRSGSAQTRFTVRLRLASAPGHVGVVATDYRLLLTAPHPPHARCRPARPPASIQSGVKGQIVGVGLSVPSRGWCAGRYRLTVFLQRGPYCQASVAGAPPPPCPEFASQDVDVGEADFIVRPGS